MAIPLAVQRGEEFLIAEDGDRRSFFRQTFGRLVKEIARRTEERVVVEQYFRPPGAIDEIAFLAACTRCSKCIDVCPPHALFQAPSSAGLAARTPMFDARRQPCTVCPDIPCASACPTGALIPPPHGWTDYHMATLELDLDRCIAFHDVECGVCARACPIGEAALALDEGGRPVLKAEGCVGCGVCVQVCVTTPSSLKLHYIEER